MLPDKVNILGIEYSIEYKDTPSEVDIFNRESLWGQIDYWTRSIRIYRNDLSSEDIWSSIIHEVLHGIVETFHLSSLKSNDNHEELDLLALALADVLFRNDWFNHEVMS